MNEQITDILKIPSDDEICNYCELEPSKNYGSPDNPYFCEGCRCEEAIKNYQDEFYNENFNIKERKEVLKCQIK